MFEYGMTARYAAIGYVSYEDRANWLWLIRLYGAAEAVKMDSNGYYI